jgi:hypothetical protein
VNGTDLVLIQYRNLPGLSELQALGAEVLGLALLLALAVEMYHLLVRGSCDFITPILRIGLAFAVIQNIEGLGRFLGGTAERIGQSMCKASEAELFAEAFKHAVSQAYDQSAWEAALSMNLFSVKTALLLFACGLYLAMMLIKLLVVDVLWPICFGLTLVLGVLAVPLGLIPGGSARGWFRTLVEVALWPVVFQFLVAMMVGSFGGLLQQVIALDGLSLFSQGISLGDASAAAEKLSQGVFVVVRFWALCAGYCLLGLGTPAVSAILMRSAPVGAALTAGAMAVGRLMAIGSAAIGRTALGAKFGSAHPSRVAVAGAQAAAASGSPGSFGSLAQAVPTRSETTRLDRRMHPEPRKTEEGQK